MKTLIVLSMALTVAACATPQPICDRDSLSQSKFTLSDDCDVPALVNLWQPDGGYEDVAGAAEAPSDVGGVGDTPSSPSDQPSSGSDAPSETGDTDNSSDGGKEDGDNDGKGGDGKGGDHGGKGK